MSRRVSISGFGADFEAQIGRVRSAEICGDPPLPGYERIVARGIPDRQHQLCLQNVAGTFVLASSSTPVVKWAEVFGAEWARYSNAAQRLAQHEVEVAVLGQLEHFFDTSAGEIDLSVLARYAPRYEWGSENCNLDALTAAAMAYGRDHGLKPWNAAGQGLTFVARRESRERG